MKQFYSNGKLLLTGEYCVLDGALALALPTKKGQWLNCRKSDLGKEGLHWKSYDADGVLWLDFQLFIENDSAEQQFLERVLLNAQRLNPQFKLPMDTVVETRLTFPRNWGWGSSSTLINNIAQWAEVNPYELLWESMPGSGYDIACAQGNSAVLYQLENRLPKVYPVYFSPLFSDRLFFVYLERKQNSRQGIAHYKSIKNKNGLVDEITVITENVLRVQQLSEFSYLMQQHEDILSGRLSIPTIQSVLFSDFQGVIKSLGAWGGDFVLAIGDKDYVHSYFAKRGFLTILPFDEVVM